MRAESVLAALCARTMNLDLRRPDPLQLNKQVAPNPRPKFPELEHALTARGTHTRGRPSGSSIPDAASALADMKQQAWLAILVSLKAGDGSRQAVYRRLVRSGEKRLGTPGFPAELRRKHHPGRPAPAENYILDLAELAILELEDPATWSPVVVKATFASVSRSQWYATMRRPADFLSHLLWSWYYEGLGHIENRLRAARGSRAL